MNEKDLTIIISNYDSEYTFTAYLMVGDRPILKAFNIDDYLKLKGKLKLKNGRTGSEELWRDWINNFREIRKKVGKVIYCEDGRIKIYKSLYKGD